GPAGRGADARPRRPGRRGGDAVTFDLERLYALLPAVYRVRDAALAPPGGDGPLKALLRVLAGQVAVVEENLEQFYDDQFVETCAPWVLPYLGDLLGVTGLSGAAKTAVSPRAEVAHTIAYRRRKGTAAGLEQLARDVTGWPARAAGFSQVLPTPQSATPVRPESRAFPDVRNAGRLEFLGGPFEKIEPATPPPPDCTAAGKKRGTRPLYRAGDLTHNVDVRRIGSGRGRYNIPNVGIFLWRLRAYPLTRSPAVPGQPGDKRRLLFSPPGVAPPLFSLPQTETNFSTLARRVNVPAPLSTRFLAGNLADYYGPSLRVEIAAADRTKDPDPVPVTDVCVCDLSDVTDNAGNVTGWAHPPTKGVAIDPERGRLAFAADQDPDQRPVLVTFHAGCSADVGGGEDERSQSFQGGLTPVGGGANPPPAPPPTPTPMQDGVNPPPAEGGVVEVRDSGRYAEDLDLSTTKRRRLELRAANKHRPVLVLTNLLKITGDPD